MSVYTNNAVGNRSRGEYEKERKTVLEDTRKSKIIKMVSCHDWLKESWYHLYKMAIRLNYSWETINIDTSS